MKLLHLTIIRSEIGWSLDSSHNVDLKISLVTKRQAVQRGLVLHSHCKNVIK